MFNFSSFLSAQHIVVAKVSTEPDEFTPVLDVFDILASRPEGSTAPPLVLKDPQLRHSS